MLKLLTYIVLGYFSYRYFIQPFFNKIGSLQDHEDDLLEDESTIKGGDYIDYEETKD